MGALSVPSPHRDALAPLRNSTSRIPPSDAPLFVQILTHVIPIPGSFRLKLTVLSCSSLECRKTLGHWGPRLGMGGREMLWKRALVGEGGLRRESELGCRRRKEKGCGEENTAFGGQRWKGGRANVAVWRGGAHIKIQGSRGGARNLISRSPLAHPRLDIAIDIGLQEWIQGSPP